jgi:hypothetical protein
LIFVKIEVSKGKEGIDMEKNTRPEIKKENEMRTKSISKMISEGGLGSEKYYHIKKEDAANQDQWKDDKENK